ncbi:hypothetical protein KJY73_03390 [Bowmanella sp. Y26]|uniref:hypothetical protein n=1 Tax=Bowmanella yangjiangensis TaxID=2811230 RepID=UPI001BDC2359|nr:hypothetical protein [Bowmanella yangjiangensis]MBT1062600.1 hypothetical protein [Bowmanella yangjiangensis]
MRLKYALLALSFVTTLSSALELHIGLTKNHTLTLDGSDISLETLRKKIDAAKSKNEPIRIVIGGNQRYAKELKEMLGELERYIVPSEPSILILQSDEKH